MFRSKKVWWLVCILFIGLNIHAQSIIKGKVTDAIGGDPIQEAIIVELESATKTNTDTSGNFVLDVPSRKSAHLRVIRAGYKNTDLILGKLKPGEELQLLISLVSIGSDQEVTITEERLNEDGIVREQIEPLRQLPSVSGNLESVLPAIALGTHSGTGGELSSQYQVRGGNYDENLVYVNDFEIYRPQLIRAGQQEGLTFANPDMVKQIDFSSGGFDSKYGDKLSSVLDITYRRPYSSGGAIAASLLGASAYGEGRISTGKGKARGLTYLVGARYKTTRYILSTLDVTGEYKPDFLDFQGLLTYDISKTWQASWLGNYSRSAFSLIPQQRTTAAGLLDFKLQLFSVFDGKETDLFENTNQGLSFTWLPERKKNPMYLKFLTSWFTGKESEQIDIIGAYSLNQIETDLSGNNPDNIVAVLGTGVQHQFVRNTLYPSILAGEIKGGLEIAKQTDSLNTGNNHFLQWGLKVQQEKISDDIKEWERLDSALYSLPYKEDVLKVFRYVRGVNELNSLRYLAYVQNTYTWKSGNAGIWKMEFGCRGQYWDLNKEFLLSPRGQISYQPGQSKLRIAYRVGGGIYQQPAFYREMRRPDGTLNTDLEAQRSWQVVGGISCDVFPGKSFKKPFRLITEFYYKKLDHLVHYDVNNVRINYSGLNDASGYIMGWDFRINGEFVPDAESWINLSVLRAREKLNGVQHQVRELGQKEGKPVADVPRPTDQLVHATIFFQDYLRRNKNFKVHLQLELGTGYPFGIPDNNITYRNTYRYDPYHRLDVGFSVSLFDRNKLQNHPGHLLRFTKNSWLSLEVFNLLNVFNEASHTWIKTVYNTQYAIPNYLTQRRINLKMRMEF